MLFIIIIYLLLLSSNINHKREWGVIEFPISTNSQKWHIKNTDKKLMFKCFSIIGPNHVKVWSQCSMNGPV